MVLNTFLLFSLFAAFTSCSTRNTSQVVALGDTVSQLDKAILVIFQDRSDNYWFGSDGQGVYRYDGKTILHFTTKDGLCNNRVREIQEDKSGNIYFNTFDGISQFDGQRFTKLSLTTTIFPTNEWKLQPNDLWFKGASGEGGVYRFDGKILHFLKFPKHYLENEFYSKYPNIP